MSTPYPSLDMPSGQKNDPYLVDQEAPSIGNAEKDALIEESQQQSRSPKNHFQTMSPRIPRKRMLPNNVNYAKEDEFENEFELQHDEKPQTNVSPSVVITPNSPAFRSYSGNEIGSPNSSGSSYRKPNWTLDIEREDEPENESRQNGLREADDGAETENEPEDDNKKYRPKKGVDVSLYTTKKNVAQGMLHIALLSANCSQLKYLLFHYERDSTSLAVGNETAATGSIPNGPSASGIEGWFSSMGFYFLINLVCIGISISLQVIVGILLIMNGRHNIYVHRYQRVADSYSNLILVAVFAITIVNIFLSVFISAR